MKKSPPLILGVHPSSRGFGWVLSEAPHSLLDWGNSDIREDHNRRALAQLIKLIQKHRPQLLALEAFDDAASRRKKRIRQLCQQLLKEAKERSLNVDIIPRLRIKQALGGVATRQQAAEAVGERIPALQPFLPKPRKIWLGEHPKMALFAAAACAIAAYRQ